MTSTPPIKTPPVTPPTIIHIDDGEITPRGVKKGSSGKSPIGGGGGGKSNSGSRKIIAVATFLTTAATLITMLGGAPSFDIAIPDLGSGGTSPATPPVVPPQCAIPETLFDGKARKLPTCRMPALLTPTRIIKEVAKPGDTYPEVLAKHPFASDFFRPPQRGVQPPVDMGNHFVRYDEQEWQYYCNNNVTDILVPDRLVFFFIQDRGSWEREPLVDHIAPFILNARMRDYYDPADFRKENDYRNFLNDYHVNKTVMTIHLSFEGEVKDPQHIVKSFVETVDCVIQHMRLWYTEEQMKKLLDDARGAIMVGEFFTSPLNLHRVLELIDWYRTGYATFDPDTKLVTVRDAESGESVVEEYPPKAAKDYNWEEDFPNPPVVVPEGIPFVLPEISTIYGTSDEFLANVPIATFNAQWRSLSPATRSYLRQYAPKMMRIERDNFTTPLHIEHVMSGFRHYGKEPISAEKAMAVKAADREYLWAFLGDLKSDRREMNATFSEWAVTNHSTRRFHCCGGSEDVRTMYQNSTFVPIGRGHANLDCFRIYEAAGSGAIPVIVGSNQEVYDTFGHFVTSKNQLPPFLFAESWPLAVREADRLLNNPFELQRKHEACVEWFYKNFHYMQRRITALGLSRDAHSSHGYETDM